MACDVHLKVSYVVSCAAWSSSYDVRVFTKDKTMKVHVLHVHANERCRRKEECTMYIHVHVLCTCTIYMYYVHVHLLL